MSRPGGERFVLGEVDLTYAEVVLYRLHGATPDPRLTLGVGATAGAIERRAIAAAVLDANCTRAAVAPSARLEPAEDAEFLAITLDGQEAAGFVEHLKLPHHVTFTSELDRVRQSRGANE
jgi:alpha-D-ribose 1-methylphosphonate 5-triphosphate synthase subunit PhnI